MGLRVVVPLLCPWPDNKRWSFLLEVDFLCFYCLLRSMWMVGVGACCTKWSCVPWSRCSLATLSLNTKLWSKKKKKSWKNWSMFQDIPLYFVAWYCGQIEVYLCMGVPKFQKLMLSNVFISGVWCRKRNEKGYLK